VQEAVAAPGCVAFDLDHFKLINDTYGHAAGDQVLKAVARAATTELRESDVFGRLGGEEFAFLLPDVESSAAVATAERTRLVFRALKFPGSQPPISVSASFGVATLDPGSDDIDSLLAKADEALIDAKRSGRNKTMVWRGTTTSTTLQVVRRRVLKAGRLVFNNRHSVVDCTIRSLWESGAELDVSSTVGIPDDDLFLGIKSEGHEWHCRVVERRPSGLQVQFC
jgi:diguanylate cyclase (GGDEF)-like protein